MSARTSTVPKRSVESWLTALSPVFEGAMASFRLAFHSTIMARALYGEFPTDVTPVQRGLLTHSMAAHLEQLSVASQSATNILVLMRSMALTLAGLNEEYASRTLMSASYVGGSMFGPDFQALLLRIQAHQAQLKALQALGGGCLLYTSPSPRD